MHSSTLVIGVIALVTPLLAQAPPSDSTITIGTRHTLRSRVLGEDRPYWVHVPPGGPRVRRPVIVVLDGDGHFHHTSGIVRFLADQGRMPPSYVVAVPNTAEPDSRPHSRHARHCLAHRGRRGPDALVPD